MKFTMENRSHRRKIYALGGLLLFALSAAAAENATKPNSTRDEAAPGQLKATKENAESLTAETYGEQPLTLKTDPLTGKVHFNTKTVDISVLNRQKDRENAEKVAIIQKDLQSRIKMTNAEQETPSPEKMKEEPSTEDPAEILKKQVKIKEDIESRIILEDDDKRYRVDSEEFYEDYKNPIKRSDVEYYEDEAMPPEDAPVSLAQRMTPKPPKEEDSFFSIFESLFGSNDDESQNSKSKVEEKQPEEMNLKQNIKTVGDILKPIRPNEDIQVKSGYSDYDEPQEYRIVNDYPQKQGFRPSEQKPYQYSYQRPNSVKPYQPYRPYPTPGYEDYDIEEFAEKNDDKFTTEKLATPKLTSVSTTTTTTTTTTKTFFNTNRPKFPVAEKKSDYVGKITQISNADKTTEKGTYYSVKSSTEATKKPDYETKVNEVKTEKIQDSANFYNLINLPVRYSTKDTAIPLISTSYANMKIQGMGANKYDKTSNGKYPNHKYDTVSNTRTTSTTRRPSYWSARRTTTQASVTTPRPTSSSREPTSTTYKTSSYKPIEFSGADYDDLAIGSSANFGGYGNKAGATKITETRVPYNNQRETTTRRVYETQKQKEGTKQDVNTYKVQAEKERTTVKTPERTTSKPSKEPYDDEYEYDSFPAMVQEVKPPKESNIKLHSTYSEKNKVFETQSDTESSYKKTPSRGSSGTSTTEPPKQELPEYEYYEYETDGETVAPSSSTTTTTNSPNYRVKYPGLSKDKIRTTSEKVAVVVPSNNQEYYIDDVREVTQSRPVSTSPKTTTTATTTRTTTTREPIQLQESSNVQSTYNQIYRPKEPAPVFEENDESDEYTPKPISLQVPRRTTTERPTTQAKPIIVTSTKKDQDNNVNIVLVPMKDPQKESQRPEGTTRPKPEHPSTVSLHKTYNRPDDLYHHSNFDYTTEFTVGAVHGHGGSVPVQGHFVATSISANPYEDDEPFRPIPKPPGLSTSFQVMGDKDDIRKPGLEIQTARPENRPPPHLNFEESEPIHEPHEFIPSPQFHRPSDTKLSNTVQQPLPSEISVDYDFDGIQTEPKPGQYVIFSKPQLNPEMNESQLKKKPEVITSPKVPSVPHIHETNNKYASESHNKHVLHSTKPNQFYTTVSDTRPPTSEKPEQKRPTYPISPELLDERLSLQLVPPKGTQTEKPFEGNFVTPEYDKVESAANYPRPHWEKNGKPTFLLPSLGTKNEINGNRPPPLPPQMAPTLIPPSSAIPQRFRKPLPPHIPPIRKNFNEGNMNMKPKPNLPNILPQFRPNAKIGVGPYQRPFHRPQGYMNPNRRNGPSRYHDKEGNFPYHIHHPSEKEAMLHRDFELEQDIFPKFITNRGKIPSELLEQHAMHKRYGGGPPNVPTRRTYQMRPENLPPLRRLQRTPVTTLQMLQQTPGVRTHKNPVLREDSEDPTVPMVPPAYTPYKDTPNTEKNVHIVYPSNVHKTRYPVINEHEKFDTFNYEYTKPEEQYPLLNPTRRINQDKGKHEFPYGFVKPDDKLKLIRKSPENNGMTNTKNVKVSTDEREIKPNLQDYMPTVTRKPIPSSESKDEKIDMNLHMQSNNQWNKVNTPEEDLMIITQNPLDSMKSTDSNGKTSEPAFNLKVETHEGNQVRINPPSEYHTSIKDENNSAFTLGAVMHTVPEGSKKGQATSVSLGDDLTIRNLDVNQRISNGKIVTVSMPLDVKEDPKEVKNNYNFQAPFQASSSIVANGAEPTNQGWSIVKSGEETDVEETSTVDVNGNRNSTKFNFENFKPELIGGFKPIYEIPEEDPDQTGKEHVEKDREEKR